MKTELKVFIKRYPSKGEFPKQDGIIVLTTNERLTYSKTFGWVTFQNYTTKAPEWWLEEIELPSGEEIGEKSNSEAWNMDLRLSENNSYETGYWEGANFILNKLKGDSK